MVVYIVRTSQNDAVTDRLRHCSKDAISIAHTSKSRDHGRGHVPERCANLPGPLQKGAVTKVIVISQTIFV